jgi:phospholipid-transporting ATPase
MPENAIRTSKYNVVTFIPLNLMSQFKKIANVYFLVNAFLSTIESISITAGKPVMLIPLSTVIIFSMMKDAYEDYRRHKNDEKENETKVLALDPRQKQNEFVPKMWQDIRVGEIFKVQGDEQIPCDMVIIHSSDPKGVCYVETKGLDGETNLKLKTAPKKLNERFQLPYELSQIDGEIICE